MKKNKFPKPSPLNVLYFFHFFFSFQTLYSLPFRTRKQKQSLSDPWLVTCFITVCRCISQLICCECTTWFEWNTLHVWPFEWYIYVRFVNLTYQLLIECLKYIILWLSNNFIFVLWFVDAMKFYFELTFHEYLSSFFF